MWLILPLPRGALPHLESPGIGHKVGQCVCGGCNPALLPGALWHISLVMLPQSSGAQLPAPSVCV